MKHIRTLSKNNHKLVSSSRCQTTPAHAVYLTSTVSKPGTDHPLQKETEFHAVDVLSRWISSLRSFIFQLAHKKLPNVLFVDNQTLWYILKSPTATALSEVMYRCPELIHNHTINSIHLIFSIYSSAEAMTKASPNKSIETATKLNRCAAPAKRVFSLHDSPYRKASYIATSSVVMTDEKPSSGKLFFHQIQPLGDITAVAFYPPARAPAEELRKCEDSMPLSLHSSKAIVPSDKEDTCWQNQKLVPASHSRQCSHRRFLLVLVGPATHGHFDSPGINDFSENRSSPVLESSATEHEGIILFAPYFLNHTESSPSRRA